MTNHLALKQSVPKNADKINPSDRCFTPDYGVDPILPYLKTKWVIWESAAGNRHITRYLQSQGFAVTSSDLADGPEYNYFRYQPARWDCQVTNLPYSIKAEWLERAYHLRKPFAFLMPNECEGTEQIHRLFRKHGIEILRPNKRIDFETENTRFEDSSSWLATSWYTYGLGIGQTLTWVTITKRPQGQIPMWTAVELSDDKPAQLQLVLCPVMSIGI